MSSPRRAAPEAVQLRQVVERLIAETDSGSLTRSGRRALESDIRDAIDQLGDLLGHLDPIRQPISVFDPSDPKVVGRFISLALVAQPRHPLATIRTNRFYGSGVYAIYYSGTFAPYAALSGSETPIYVGQAAPAVPNARSPREQGDRLARRLDEHLGSIESANASLAPEDFEFRSLVVQSGWETPAEEFLIHLFRPVWNSETKILFGIGKHGDDAGTRANKRSPWDVMHPGRGWAADTRLVDAKPRAQIEEELDTHFAAHPVFPDIEAVLASFIEELRQI